MSNPALRSRFYVESDSESEPEPPKPKAAPRLTPQHKKKLERQQRFDEQQEAQKQAQAAASAESEEANRRRRERKARAQQKKNDAAGGSDSNCTPDVFTELAVLGLTPKDNTIEAINRAFRKLALKHHPDKGGDPEKFKPIGVAHAFLLEMLKQ